MKASNHYCRTLFGFRIKVIRQTQDHTYIEDISHALTEDTWE